VGSELLRDLSAERSDDLASAVERCVAALRKNEVRDTHVVALCERLVELAGHEDRLVRTAVATAGQYLPDAYFDQIVPRLTKDRNVYVREAANRSIKVRSARRRENVMLDDQAAHIDKLARRIEQDYDKKARRLAQELADRSTQFFAQKLHHEFKRLAANLQITVSNLKSAAQQPQIDRDRLVENAAAAAAVLQLLLSVVGTACDVSDVVPPRYKPESLRSMLQQALDLLRDHMDAVRLDATIDVDEGLTLDADRGKLLQAFLNILQNSAEAYPDLVPITIRITAKTAKGGTQLVVSFADDGCGIGADELPHVFAPFGTSKTREPRVRGLGLLNVKRMIESAHGGEVRIESVKGAGTTVIVTLPRRQKA
jgi:signal transduction histidine kinase